MHVFRGLPETADVPVALTIGNFDGVHRGHQAMLSRLLEAAEDLALPPAVLTFDPHPREFFGRASAPPRLSTLRGKLEAFAAQGIERTYIARFNAAMAGLSPATFIEREAAATPLLLLLDNSLFGVDEALVQDILPIHPGHHAGCGNRRPAQKA